MITRGSDGVEIWWESHGSGPAVLLVPGRGDSSDIYPARFVDRLVASGASVVVYDPRDTGLSGDGGGSYDLAALADDAIAVLDAAGVDRAHLVGLSMGGLLLADLAPRAAGRIASLMFLSASSPDPDAGIGPDFFEMMGDDPVAAVLGAMNGPSDEDRAWVGSEMAAMAERAPARPDAGELHQAAVYRSEWPTLEALSDVTAPTLVIHGGSDRKLPVAHGRAFAAAIPGARLVELADMGHLPRPGQWSEIGELVASHIAATGTPDSSDPATRGGPGAV